MSTTGEMSTTAARDEAGRQQTAIGKVIAVLEALADDDRLTGVAEATGLPPSTVHRILTELTHLGWVHVSDRSYTPGPGLLSLSRRLDTDGALARLAFDPVRRLCDRTGYTVHFGVLHGDVAIYALKREGRRAYLMRSRVGDSLALHCTAIGKAALSRMPEARVREVAARTGLPAATEATITDVEALVQHLDQVRRRGWAMDDGENEDHTRCVGAAVVDSSGTPIGGISLSALDFDMSREAAQQMADKVVATAREISAAVSA
ncbi:MAG: IclR family transcriptional regulator [Actinomycetes bacterium]